MSAQIEAQVELAHQAIHPSAPRQRPSVKLDRAQLEDYLLGSLHWSAIRWQDSPELVERAVECYRYLAGRFYDQGKRGFTHVPLHLVMDLLALIEQGDRAPFASESGAHLWGEWERPVRVDYENSLLGTLLQERAFAEARERLTARGPMQPGAARRLVELLLQRFGRYYPDWIKIDPSYLRDFSLPTWSELDAGARATRLAVRMGDGALFLDGLQVFLKEISEGIYWRELLREEDLFEIENWSVLDTEAKRIGVRQIAEVERRLGELRLPRVKLRDEAMEAETNFADDTIYPAGGFSGLTNRGSFDNLVRSELVYLGEGKPVSLFDLRFIENELLFYMRNDGVMRRKRRFIHIIFDIDLAFHYKSPGLEYPFSTLTQGMAVRVVRDLLSTFESDAVTVQIHYIHRPPHADKRGVAAQEAALAQFKKDREAVAREVALMELMFGRELRQERLTLALADDLDPYALPQQRGRVYAVCFVFGADGASLWKAAFDELEHHRPPVFGLVIQCGLPSPDESAFEDAVPLLLPLEGAPFVQVGEIKNAIFSRIMSGRR
jgi:hypothetical protein